MGGWLFHDTVQLRNSGFRFGGGGERIAIVTADRWCMR